MYKINPSKIRSYAFFATSPANLQALHTPEVPND